MVDLSDIQLLLQILIAVVIWVTLGAGVALYARDKLQNAGAMFFVSLFLSPLAALIWIGVVSSENGRKDCPFCASIIREAAKRCPHCCSDLRASIASAAD